MKQLNAGDAIFLSMETPSTPGHVGGLGFLDPTGREAFDFESLRDFICERVYLCPRFGWKVQEIPFALDRPYWIDDEDYDPSDHIKRVAVPRPGGAEELAELVGLLYARPIDRDRPLWEIFVIEGLQGGRVGLLWKMHHCLMDGTSGAGLGEVLFDLEADPAPRERVVQGDFEAPGAKEGWWTVATNSVKNASARRTSLRENIRKAAGAAVADWREREKAEELPPVPRASFNGEVSSRRAISWTTVSLDEVKRLKKELGVTVNDIVLSISAGALRRLLEANGEPTEDTLWASVPVSMRKEGDLSVGNQIRDISVAWGTHIADPLERVRYVHKASKRAKQDVEKDTPSMLGVLTDSLPPFLTSAMVRLTELSPDSIPLPANAVVSNVAGAPVPLYIHGAKVEKFLPISLLAPTQGLNVTVISYQGEIQFGFTVDPALVPNPWLLSDAIPKALVELQEAVDQRG